MEIKDLEQAYTIHIEKKDEKYLVYNYFGRLIKEARSLSEIKRFMDAYFKEKRYETIQNEKG